MGKYWIYLLNAVEGEKFIQALSLFLVSQDKYVQRANVIARVCIRIHIGVWCMNKNFNLGHNRQTRSDKKYISQSFYHFYSIVPKTNIGWLVQLL